MAVELPAGHGVPPRRAATDTGSAARSSLGPATARPSIPLHELLTQGLVPQIRPGRRTDRGAARPSVVARVARVDVLGVDAEQLGDLLDDDGQHHRLEVGAGLAAVLDRPAEQHQPGRRRARARAPARPAARSRRVQSSGSCGVSSTAYSTRPSRSCQRVSMSRDGARATSSSNRSPRVGSSGRPGSGRRDGRPAHAASAAVAASRPATTGTAGRRECSHASRLRSTRVPEPGPAAPGVPSAP